MSQAHEVQQHLDEVKSLRERLGLGQWQEEDWGLLERVLGSYERLLAMLCEAQITLKRLQTLLFGKRRQRRHGVASGTAARGGRSVDATMRAVLTPGLSRAWRRRAMR
jgi:hypothetical protein